MSYKELENAYEQRYLSRVPWWFRATYKALEEEVYQKKNSETVLLRRGSSRGSGSPFASDTAFDLKVEVDAALSKLARLIKEG